MATAAPAPSLGRGRGRGRGLRAANMAPAKPGPPPASPKIESPKPPSAQLAASLSISSPKPSGSADISSIMKRMDKLTESEIMQQILPEIIAIPEQEKVVEFVRALSEKAIGDSMFGVTAAKLAAKVWEEPTSHILIRNPLLKQTQEDYTKRDTLSKEKFYGLCVYVSGLFKYLRVKNAPLRPVGDAVVQVLKELMQGKGPPSDEDVLYFYQELENVGEVLEECLPVKMEEIINIARQMVISAKLLPSIRCRLVQLVELHAAKWKMADELKVLYEDMQQDFLSEGQ